MKASKQLEKLLKNHGLNLTKQYDWFLVNGQLPAIRVCVNECQTYDNATTVQVDIEVAWSVHECLVESFAGIGHDKEIAISNGIENFCQNTLHVLLAALWNVSVPEQVTHEVWEFHEAKWEAFIGNFSCRAHNDITVAIPESVFPTCKRIIKTQSLDGVRHWFRFFYCNIDNTQSTTEVLRDNDVWTEAQNAMAQLDWEKTGTYYSVRNFLILKRVSEPPQIEGYDNTKEREDGIAWLMKTIASTPQEEDDVYYDELVMFGVEDALAREIVQMTPIAFGRHLLKDMDIAFSPYYVAVNADGDEQERGRLDEHPVYTHAKMIAKSAPGIVLKVIAFRSAEVKAVNAALNAGSQLHDLTTGPVIMFSEEPTETGFAKVQERLQHEPKSRSDSRRKAPKQWWKFWS